MSTQNYKISAGKEDLELEQTHGDTVRVTVRDEDGEASIVIDAVDLRNLMVVMGTFAEPYPGAWNRLGRYQDE